MLAANQAILLKRFPTVLERILAVGNRMPESFFYESKDGVATLMVQRGEHAYCPYGNYNKYNLLKRWHNSLRVAPESLYAITGFGDGSHLEYFLNESASGTFVLATEKDPALLRETFSRFDLSELLSHERFLLSVGELDDPYFAHIQNAALTRIQEVNSLVFSPLHSVNETYYDKMRNELVRQYLVIRPLMEVNIRTAINLQENTLRNLEHMAYAPDIGVFKDQFKEVPFILVGAGPSLDESIDFLKFAQDKAIIVTTNSPLRKLVNSGIKPHLVVTADPMPPTLAGFQGVDVSDLTLACPHSAYPKIVEKFPGRIISWCTFNPIVDYLKSKTNQLLSTPIMEQGTVSGCVLDISHLLGCKKILFVGQDMSVQDDGKYYTDDSSYSDSGAHYYSGSKGQRLPGNTQETVHVEQRLFVYLKTFEQFIKSKGEGREYRNLARTGVKIEGVPYLSFEEAKTFIDGCEDNSRFSDRVGEVLNEPTENLMTSEIFEPAIKNIEKILEKCLGAAIQTEMLPEKLQNVNYSNNKSLTSLIDEGQEVNKLIDVFEKEWSILVEGKTKGELVIYKRKIRDILAKNPSWQIIQRNKEYFWAISEGAHWFLDIFSKTIHDKSTVSQE
jgi:hypothetical protein